MPSNQTPNYKLSQWEKSDRIQMEDFNADNAKIDAALKAEANAHTALAAQVAKLGNCRIWTGSYTGNGICGLNKFTTFTFPKKPLFAVITHGSGLMAWMLPWDGWFVVPRVNGHSLNHLKWSGSKASWCLSVSNVDSSNAYEQLNDANITYRVIAWIPMDE